MNPVLTRLLDDRTVPCPDGRERPLHSDLPAAEGALLQHWLGEHPPVRLLEIGLAYGISTQFICDAVADRTIDYYHVIDPHQAGQWHGAGIFNLERAGYRQLITLYEELSELCLPDLLRQGMSYDFAFVDGWHSFDQTLVEFFYINRMLEVGGIVVFDDVHLPALQKLLSYIATYRCYEPLALPESIASSVQTRVRRIMSLPPMRLHGFRKVEEDRRDWDWFADFG